MCIRDRVCEARREQHENSPVPSLRTTRLAGPQGFWLGSELLRGSHINELASGKELLKGPNAA
eukprot:7591344-Alexandrium_andersonii.AAC.1